MSEPVSVIAPICQHPFGWRETVQKGSRPGVITDLTYCYEEVERMSAPVGDGMQLRFHPVFAPSDQTAGALFFNLRLETARWALR
jgi:hypothetical protein